MRRILYLTMNPNLGASARTLQTWLLDSVRYGYHPCVVLRNTGDLHHWLQQHRIPHLLDPMPLLNRYRPWHAIYHALRVNFWARKQRACLIHCYEHNLYPFATLLRRILPRPLICHVHFVFGRDYAEWAFNQRWKTPDTIAYVSHQEANDCQAAVRGIIPLEKQCTIHLGLDLSQFGTLRGQRKSIRTNLGVNDEDVVIGTAAAIRSRKQPDHFMHLVRVLRQRGRQILGVYAGDVVPGEEIYSKEIIPQFRALESEGGFRWLGNVEPIEPLLHALDIYVSTSNYETFGMAVLEAMACGCPVVGYRAGSVQEVIGSAGYLVADGHLDDLVEQVDRLVNSRELRLTMGQLALERVRSEFTAEQSLERMCNIYDQLLETQQPR